MNATSPDLNLKERSQIVLDVIRTRRAIRAFQPVAVPIAQIREVIAAARWSSSASNRRLHRYLVVRDPVRIQLARALSPGMITAPPVLIVICTDLEKAKQSGVQPAGDVTTWIDVGTSVMNMMIAAHAIGLGSCPVTSFSPSGVETALDLPTSIKPELLLMLGVPAADRRGRSALEKLDPDEITDWETFGGRLSPAELAESAS